MYDNSQLQQQAGQNVGGFAAHPKVVHQKPKFKDPYGISQPDEYYPQNIMYDKRVFRGSTNAAMVIPAGQYSNTLFNDRKERAKAKAQARAAAAEEFFTRDVRTPEPLQGRQNIDIQTDQFVEELTDKAPCYEIGCQTEIKIDRPQTPRFMAKKTGIDKKTLVEDNELFLFDDEVEPILSVLCGKTLEQARMEVLEEEELREMKEQQEHYIRMLNSEKTDIERMESTEAKRLADFEKLKNQMREKKKQKQLAHRKIVARVQSKNYLAHLKENTIRSLAQVGFYTNKFKIEVLDNDVIPWLYEKTFEFVQDLEVQESVPTQIAKEFISNQQQLHSDTVQNEKDRKQRVKLEKERQLAEKLEQKRKRREEKERLKLEAERLALREEIENEFIKKGAPQAPIADFEVVEMDGNGEVKPIIGGLGGILGQMIIVLSILEKNFNRTLTSKSQKSKKSSRSKKDDKKAEEEKVEAPVADQKPEGNEINQDEDKIYGEPVYLEKGWFDRQHVQSFIHLYLESKMKTAKMSLVVGQAYKKFLDNLEKPIEFGKARQMKEPNYTKLRELIRTPKLMGNSTFKAFAERAEDIGISMNAYNMVHEGFWDIYWMKPFQTTGLTAKKLQQWHSTFVSLKLPAYLANRKPDDDENEDESPKEPQVKAVVRIRIPFKKIEEEEGGADIESKSAKSKASRADSRKSAKEPVKEEIEWEDRAQAVPTRHPTLPYQIRVLHQLPQRLLREHIAKEFKEFLKPELDPVTDEEMFAKVENEAEAIEDKFLKIIYKDLPVFDFELN